MGGAAVAVVVAAAAVVVVDVVVMRPGPFLIWQIRVHYDGWNSRFDEWIRLPSERLSPMPQSKMTLEQARTSHEHVT